MLFSKEQYLDLFYSYNIRITLSIHQLLIIYAVLMTRYYFLAKIPAEIELTETWLDNLH